MELEPDARTGSPCSCGKVSQEADGVPPAPPGLAPYTPPPPFFSRRRATGRGDQRQYSVTNCRPQRWGEVDPTRAKKREPRGLARSAPKFGAALNDRAVEMS